MHTYIHTAPWLRTNEVSTNGAAAKVINFDRLRQKICPGTLGNITVGAPHSLCVAYVLCCYHCVIVSDLCLCWLMLCMPLHLTPHGALRVADRVSLLEGIKGGPKEWGS